MENHFTMSDDIKKIIKDALNEVYWRGCTDGNEGSGWENAFTNESNPEYQIIHAIIQTMESFGELIIGEDEIENVDEIGDIYERAEVALRMRQRAKLEEIINSLIKHSK